VQHIWLPPAEKSRTTAIEDSLVRDINAVDSSSYTPAQPIRPFARTATLSTQMLPLPFECAACNVAPIFDAPALPTACGVISKLAFGRVSLIPLRRAVRAFADTFNAITRDAAKPVPQ